MHPRGSTSGSGVVLRTGLSTALRLGQSARTIGCLTCKSLSVELISHQLASNGTRENTMIEPVEFRPILPYKGPLVTRKTRPSRV